MAGAMLQSKVWTIWRDVMRAGIQSRGEGLRLGQAQGAWVKSKNPQQRALGLRQQKESQEIATVREQSGEQGDILRPCH